MAQSSWARIADLFAELVELPKEDQHARIDSEDISAEDKAALVRLLAENSGNTGFLATGGAINNDLALLEPGAVVGSWRVIDIIGQGGMGEVYRVERADGHYTQTAALKRITFADEAAFERFERERQILAQLEHPNIGRLIDGGVDEKGAPYLVMEFIEGRLLTEYVKDRKLSQDDRLKAFLTVCAALEHAHNRLVLHRDIKPSNMMVTTSGEIKLIDFGVAGLVDEGEDEDRAPYTPGYAAPEQMAGHAVSVQTDIYGLGVSLAEILTGLPPVPGQPLKLSALPADLRAIIGKATARTPTERYQSVESLVGDIRNYQFHRPVGARNGSIAYQSGLFLRRNYLVLGLFGVLVAGIAGTYWQYRKAEIERDVALAQHERLITMQSATFLMFSQAGSKADEQSARGLIKQSAEQAMKDFEENPKHAAVVLHMFGELLFLINDYVAAEPLLKSVAEMPTKTADEDLIARANHDLANVYLRSGKPDEARIVLEKAMTIWQQTPERYQDQILAAALIESQLLSAEGETEAAGKLLEETLPKRLALSGDTAMETAILLTNIGVARMRQGDFPGAIEASEKAQAAFRTQQRLKTPDGLNTMNNLASLYHITGKLDDAETAYASALEIRESLYGPSAALAVLMSNYGKLKLQQGKSAEAEALLTRAVAMADEYSGPASPPALAARFGLIETHTVQGSAEAAREVLNRVTSHMETANMTTGPYVGMLHLASAQTLIVEGKTEDALKELQTADEIFTAIGPPAARYSAKVKQVRDSLTPAQE